MVQTYKGQIRRFPEEIVNRMLECQVEQGNPKDISVFEHNCIAGKCIKGFTWSETKEGQSFWSKIIDHKNFDHFYTIYPKSPDLKQDQEFVLPEKWCVKSTTENKEILNDFLSKKGYRSRLTNIAFVHYPFIGGTGSVYFDIQKGYREITFEQFKKYVLKETSDSKFKVGTWYKTFAGSLIKYKNSNNGVFNASEHFMYDTLNKLKSTGVFGSINNEFKEVSLDEMQQYLPDGHPDKISKFKIGDRVIATGNVSGYENQKGTIVDIDNQSTLWKYIVSFESTKVCIWAKVHSLVDETDNSSLLEEANRRFPIGSKFKCQLGGFKGLKDDGHIRKKELHYNIATGSISASDERYVYFQGEWAELVEDPQNYSENLLKKETMTSAQREAIISPVYEHPSEKNVMIDRNKYYKVNSSEQYHAVLDYFESKGEKTDDCYRFEISSWSYVYFDGDCWMLGTEVHITTQTPEDIKMLGIVESKFESVSDPLIQEKDLFQVGNYAVCIRKGMHLYTGYITQINKILNENEFVGDNLKSNYKSDYKAFKSMREANAFANGLSKLENLSDSVTLSTLMQKPLTVKESYPTKETIKTQVVSTNIINISLKSKKKKSLFTI